MRENERNEIRRNISGASKIYNMKAASPSLMSAKACTTAPCSIIMNERTRKKKNGRKMSAKKCLSK